MIDEKRAEEARRHLFSGRAFYEEEKPVESEEKEEMDPMYRNDREKAQERSGEVLRAVFSGKTFKE